MSKVSKKCVYSFVIFRLLRPVYEFQNDLHIYIRLLYKEILNDTCTLEW